MIYLIYAFGFLALYHFVYESIIAPNLRLKIRYRLFSLRDKLRNIEMDESDELDTELFEHLDRAISMSIKNMRVLKLSLLYYGKEDILKNEVMQKRIERRINLVESCPIKEVKDISNSFMNNLSLIFLINSGGWIIYIIPIFILWISFSYIKKLATQIIYAPEEELEKVISTDDYIIIQS